VQALHNLATDPADSDNCESCRDDAVRPGNSRRQRSRSGSPIIYHLVWGTLTFIVLVATTVLARRDFGVSSTLFKVAVASIADFVVQGVLGLFALGSDVAVVVHLTNAFLLAVIVTYLISFADSADRASTSLSSQPKIASPSTYPSVSQNYRVPYC